MSCPLAQDREVSSGWIFITISDFVINPMACGGGLWDCSGSVVSVSSN